MVSSPSPAPPPASPPASAQPSDRPPPPPPSGMLPPSPPLSVADRRDVLVSLDDLLAASTVVVRGTPESGLVGDKTCRRDIERPPACAFQEFRVESALAGAFIDGSVRPRTIELRIWALNPRGPDLGPDGQYVLFLYPFEWVRDEPEGDYQVGGLFAGDDRGALRSLDGETPELAAITDISEVRPGMVRPRV